MTIDELIQETKEVNARVDHLLLQVDRYRELNDPQEAQRVSGLLTVASKQMMALDALTTKFTRG